jgi:hypothetical protein
VANVRTLVTVLVLAAAARAQEAPPKPEVRINYLNVCAPSAEEQQVLSGALKSVPKVPAFAADFEISRGKTTMPDAPLSSWVRVRREFASGTFSNVQYSVTVDENAVVETLVFRVRDPKDVMQIAISNSVTGGVAVQDVLAANAPASRVKVERFGKSSVGLARCPQGDQTAYEPLFQSATALFKNYRNALNTRRTVLSDLARLGVKPKPAAASVPKKP